MDRLRFLGGSAAALASVAARAASASTGAGSPLVPFRLYSQHWDEHYFAWLPSHPRFEAIEVMTADRGPSTPPLHWAFFTERAGAKTQVHYYDDADVARGAGARYAKIGLELGAPNAAGIGDATIAFTDEAGLAVRWRVGFAPDASFAPAGLTDQSGHAADRIALYFYREKTAPARAATVTIGDAPFPPSLSYDGTQPAAPGAYSRNIFTAVVPYGDYGGRLEGTSLVLSDGTRLAPRPGGDGLTGDGVVLRMREGALLQYRVAPYGRPTTFTFEGPLRAGRTRYALAFDDGASVLSGTALVTVEGAITTIVMQPESPAWSRGYGFTTRFERSATGFRAATRRTPA